MQYRIATKPAVKLLWHVLTHHNYCVSALIPTVAGWLDTAYIKNVLIVTYHFFTQCASSTTKEAIHSDNEGLYHRSFHSLSKESLG